MAKFCVLGRHHSCCPHGDGARESMHGLIIVCMIPGAMPFEKRTCMINADHILTAHVKDGFSLDDLSSDTMISCCAHESDARLHGGNDV